MYAKVRRSMFEGTLAGTGETWAVFVFLLAHSDPEGFVDIHPKAISGLTGFSEEGVRAALAKLEAADQNSRRPDAEGARIVRVDEHRDWGWHITNYKYYRSSKDEQTVREQTAARVRKHRNKSAPVSQGNADVTHGNALKRHVEVEVEVDVEAEEGNESKDSSLRSVSENGVSKKKRKTPTTNREVDREWMETFDETWWPEYLTLGRKCSRAAARDVWAKIPHLEGQVDFDRLNSEWESTRAAWAEEKREPRYIPHAEVWLRDYLKNLALEAS